MIVLPPTEISAETPFSNAALNALIFLGVLVLVLEYLERIKHQAYNGTGLEGGLGSPATVLFSELLNSFTGNGIVTASHSGVSSTSVSNAGNNTGMLNSLIGTTAPSNTAEAFINIILFDDNLNIVGYGSDPVQQGGGYKLHTTMVNTPINVSKNGYAYIYVSNESDQRGEDMEILGATNADLDFIAHARQDIPKLIEEIRILRKLLK